MTRQATQFTPEVLLSAPRRSAGIPNSTGELILYTVSSPNWASDACFADPCRYLRTRLKRTPSLPRSVSLVSRTTLPTSSWRMRALQSHSGLVSMTLHTSSPVIMEAHCCTPTMCWESPGTIIPYCLADMRKESRLTMSDSPEPI